MKKKLTALAGFAWAGVAISIATPASAVAITAQMGEYGACSAQAGATIYEHCWSASYTQVIKLVTTACNNGMCVQDSGVVYTSQVYPTGRHIATLIDQCDNMNMFALGACAC